ncbi:MAG TPA: lysylphosphatidylglycerol synthase domain-containing protein [Bacteroidota bacterium]|nr:lysylphosphatidylglycerol synthase domain-containing protein [Bacteroidota bacterium]
MLLPSHIIWYLPLVLVPFLAGMVLDTAGWSRLLGTPAKVPFRKLLGVHIGTESLLLTLPGGFAVSDAAKVVLLKRGGNIQPPETLASLLARRWLLGSSQFLFVFGSIILGLSFRSGSDRGSTIPFAGELSSMPVLLAAAVTLVVGVIILTRGGVAAGTHRLLSALLPRRHRDRLDKHLPAFLEVDACLSTFGRRHWYDIGLVFLLFFLSWVMDALETVVIARVIGFDAGFVAVLIVEAILSVVKLAVFFLPSGIVVKDLGYVALFGAAGIVVSAPQIAVFIAAKRLVNVVWIVIGLIVLLGSGYRLPKKRAALYKTAVEPS